jgi:hypothetical protein
MKKKIIILIAFIISLLIIYILHQKESNLIYKGITIKDPDFNEIARLLKKEFGESFISSILELDEESIVCITKVFTGRNLPSE